MSADLALVSGTRGARAPAGARAADQPGVLDHVAVFAFGLSLQFNVLTATFGLPFLRLSDLVPFLVIPYLCLRTDFVARALDNAPRLGVVLALMVPVLFLKTDKGPGDLYNTLVLALYFILALQILTVRGGGLLPALCVGILVGYFGSLAVLLAAGAGVDLEPYGLAVPIDVTTDPLEISFRQDKLGGLWSSGNQTGHIFAAAGAAALYLTLRTRFKIFYLAYFMGLIVSFPLTNNRAGLLAPVLGLIFMMRRELKLWQFIALGAVVGAVALYVGTTGINPLPAALADAVEKRLYGDSHLDGNVSERFGSGFDALGLIVRNPFGIGILAMENTLMALAGVPTPHNGILSLALMSGLPVALFYVMGLFQTVAGGPRACGWFVYLTVLFSTPSMFFEQLTETQYFLFVIAVVLAAWTVRGGTWGTLPHPHRDAPTPTNPTGGAVR